jgi:hypothetical protein
MKQVSIFIIICFLISNHTLSAQSDSSDYALQESLKYTSFAYLTSGKIIEGTTVELNRSLLARPSISVDDLKMKLSEVKFYQGRKGFHANIGKIGFLSTRINFAKKIVDGEINLYEFEKTYVHNNGRTSYMNSYTTKKTYSYYNKGFGDVRKATYENLSLELRGNPLALSELKKYQTQKYRALGLYAGGVLLVASSIFSLNRSQEPNLGHAGLLVGGAVLYWSGYLVSRKKHKYLRTAVAMYNIY